MQTDFDTPTDRRDTGSLKWDRYGERDVIPMWLADMDFAAPKPILDALRKRIAHGVLGYSIPGRSLMEAVREHLRGEYGWEVAADWLVWLPGVVPGLNAACRACAQGGPVLVQTPVYPPFLKAPGQADVGPIPVPLAIRHGRYEMDFDALEGSISPDCRLLLLCNPENPGGTLHGPNELQRLLDFAQAHDLTICSDEIHCGLVLAKDRRHTPFAAIGEEAAARSIVLMAPSKTYNIPGLSCAFAMVPDPAVRERFRKVIEGIVPDVNALGLIACEAAYRECGDWHCDLIDYLRGNLDLLEQRVRDLPGLRMHRPEATYLAWIDCRESGLDNPTAFFEERGVGLGDGAIYGSPGFVRLNFACPRARLADALDRMENGLRNR